MFEGFFDNAQEILKLYIDYYLPGISSTFLGENTFLVLSIISVLVVLGFLILAFFLDFIKDVWKIPIAIGVDLLNYLGLVNPIFAIASGVLGFVVFLGISKAGIMKWPFALISLASGLVLLPSVLGGEPMGVIILVLPINTVMMFISTIID